MATREVSDVVQFLRGLAGDKPAEEPSDDQLIQRFVARRDEAAFAAILARHGALVFGACRQILRDAHAAEDAFQATFLVLARKAATIRDREALAAWLHRVAVNISRSARTDTNRRRAHETQVVPPMPSTAEAPAPDWRARIHEEVDHLPTQYRLPVVLCYLEGQTHEAAAAQLGWPLGSVKGRLARARELLRTRLARRGLTLTATALGTALTSSATAVAVPPALLTTTLRAAVHFASAEVAPVVPPTRATVLAHGALRTMTGTKLLPVVVLLFAVTLVGFGATASGWMGRDAGANAEAPRTPAPRNDEPAPAKGAPQPKRPVVNVSNALKLSLQLDKLQTHIKSGGTDIEPVNLRFTYANVSDHPIRLDLSTAAVLCGTRLEVAGPGVSKSSGKKPVLQPEKLTAESFRVLEPGKEWSIELPFPTYEFFGALFVLKQPGEYRIRTVYCLEKETDSPLARGSWLGTATSNEVVLTVLAADGFGEEVRGLRARVTLPKEKFEVGEPIPVSYVVKNVSKEEQTIWHSGFWMNHLIVVEDAAGKEPPLTEFGQQCRRVFSPGGERWKNVAVKVAPGGEDAAYEKYDLAMLYDLSKPGRYAVQYVYEEKQGGWEGRLHSNAPPFEVVAKIEKDNSLVESKSVRLNDAEFQAAIEPRPLAPPVSGERDIDLGFRITNRTTDKALLFGLNRLEAILKSADGTAIKQLGMSKRSAFAAPVMLSPGQSQTVLWRGLLGFPNLPKDTDLFELRYTDGTAFGNRFGGLKPGKYRLSFQYEVDEQAANTLASRYGELPKAVVIWTGKVTTEEVEFEILTPAKPTDSKYLRPIGILVTELESADGATRLSATKDLFARGKDAIADLEKAGAKSLLPARPGIPRRLDVVYSLLKGLPDNPLGTGAESNCFGLHLDVLQTQADVERMGKQYGFSIRGDFSKTGSLKCFVTPEKGKKLPDVMRAVLTGEAKVITLQLNIRIEK
jgi:RNA polymerase sigma factor (sigma-70 family)